jgi:hypothetical protein
MVQKSRDQLGDHRHWIHDSSPSSANSLFPATPAPSTSSDDDVCDCTYARMYARALRHLVVRISIGDQVGCERNQLAYKVDLSFDWFPLNGLVPKGSKFGWLAGEGLETGVKPGNRVQISSLWMSTARSGSLGLPKGAAGEPKDGNRAAHVDPVGAM